MQSIFRLFYNLACFGVNFDVPIVGSGTFVFDCFFKIHPFPYAPGGCIVRRVIWFQLVIVIFKAFGSVTFVFIGNSLGFLGADFHFLRVEGSAIKREWVIPDDKIAGFCLFRHSDYFFAAFVDSVIITSFDSRQPGLFDFFTFCNIRLPACGKAAVAVKTNDISGINR